MKSGLDFNNIVFIATNIGYLIAGVFICYFVVRKKVSEYLSGVKKDLSVSYKIPKQAKYDIDIVRKMEQVKEIFNADRVQVYEFHNGEHYANGRSALKVSCTYEVYRVNIEPVQTKMTSIPISCIPHFITQLLDEEFIKVPNVENIKDKMPSTYSLQKSIGVSAYQNLIIKNDNNEPVGFVSIQWCNGNKMNSDDKELYRLAAYVEERIINEVK